MGKGLLFHFKLYWIVDNSEIKGHFRRGEALIHLGRDKEAVLAYEVFKSFRCFIPQIQRAIELGGGSAAATALLRAQKKYISSCLYHLDVPSSLSGKFFSPIVQKLPVEVKYHSLERGRGVYASRGLKKGELIYHDAPVASHQLVKSNSVRLAIHSLSQHSSLPSYLLSPILLFAATPCNLSFLRLSFRTARNFMRN